MATGNFGAALEDPSLWEEAETEDPGAHAALQTDDDTAFAGAETPPPRPAQEPLPGRDEHGLTAEQLELLGEAGELPPNLAAQAQVAAGVTPQSAPPAAPLRDYLVESLGLRGLAEAADDGDALGRLVQYMGQLQQQNQQLSQAQQYYQMQLAQSRAPAAPPATSAEASKPAWEGPPEFNPRWLEHVQRENGRLVAKPGALPDLPAKIEAYDQWVQDQSAKLWKNPVDFLRGAGLDDAIRPLIQQSIQEAIGGYSARSFGEQLRREHGDWLFQRDPMGNPVFDPARGGFAVTPEGRQVTQHLAELVALGMPQDRAWQIATRLVSGEGTLAHQAWMQSQGQQGAEQNLNDPATRQQLQQQQNTAFLQRSQRALKRPNNAGNARTTATRPRRSDDEAPPLTGPALMDALFARNLAALRNGTA